MRVRRCGDSENREVLTLDRREPEMTRISKSMATKKCRSNSSRSIEERSFIRSEPRDDIEAVNERHSQSDGRDSTNPSERESPRNVQRDSDDRQSSREQPRTERERPGDFEPNRCGKADRIGGDLRTQPRSKATTHIDRGTKPEVTNSAEDRNEPLPKKQVGAREKSKVQSDGDAADKRF